MKPLKIGFHIRLRVLLTIGFLGHLGLGAQGILDTLAAPKADTQTQVSVVPSVNSYSRKAYLKDSANLRLMRDSIAKKWTFDDTLPPERNHNITFAKSENVELKRRRVRPILFTILFFFVVTLFVLKWAIYKGKTRLEYRAILRRIFYREWLQEQQSTLSFYVVYSKIVSLLTVGLFLSYLAFRLNMRPINPSWLMHWIVFFSPLVLVILKYICGLILSYLFSNSEMFRHHFTYNQLIDNFLLVPLLLSFTFSYFLEGVWEAELFILLGLSIMLLARLSSFIIFTSQTLFNRQYKKLYVIFYLCSLEIVPLFILVRWIAKNYT